MRSVAAAVAAVFLSACASPNAPQAPPAAGHSDWPMYQYSADRNAAFSRPAIRVHWVFDTKGQINGGLAVSGSTLLLDTFKKDVIALDLETGALRWRTGGFRNILMSTPIVANGLVFVGTGGNPILDTHSDLGMRFQYGGKKVLGIPGGDEVAALDLRTGVRRWSFHTVGENMPSPAYYQGRVIFANGDWHAYALRADNGKLLWKTPVNGHDAMSSAAVVGSSIIAGVCARGIAQSSTVALEGTTGRLQWEAPYGHCDGAPSYGQGLIFAESVEPGAMKYVGRTRVAAFDARTGKLAWSYRGEIEGEATDVGSAEGSIAGMYHDGVYYQAAPLDDQFLAFDAKTGKRLWALHTAGPVKMSAVIQGRNLYFGDTTGVLYLVDAPTGKIKGLEPYRLPFATSPPVIIGRTLFVVNGTSVYALPI